MGAIAAVPASWWRRPVSNILLRGLGLSGSTEEEVYDLVSHTFLGFLLLWLLLRLRLLTGCLLMHIFKFILVGDAVISLQLSLSHALLHSLSLLVSGPTLCSLSCPLLFMYLPLQLLCLQSMSILFVSHLSWIYLWLLGSPGPVSLLPLLRLSIFLLLHLHLHLSGDCCIVSLVAHTNDVTKIIILFTVSLLVVLMRHEGVDKCILVSAYLDPHLVEQAWVTFWEDSHRILNTKAVKET